MAHCNQCGAALTEGEEDLIGEGCECGGDFVEEEKGTDEAPTPEAA